MNDKRDCVPAAAGDVFLRGAAAPLDCIEAELFIVDCARNTEGLLSDLEVRTKYELTSEQWERLAENTQLLHKVRAERARRILTGECAREAAQRHFAKAPEILNRILIDEQVPTRHRIEAARELRQAAGHDPSIAPGQKERVTITINLGADTEVIEKELDLRRLSSPDDGDRYD